MCVGVVTTVKSEEGGSNATYKPSRAHVWTRGSDSASSTKPLAGMAEMQVAFVCAEERRRASRREKPMFLPCALPWSFDLAGDQ